MVHVLGVNLPDRRLVKIALTAFTGISHSTSRLICARLAFHDRLAVSDLTEPQINQLSALLSSPSTFMGPAPTASSSSAAATSTANAASSSSTTSDDSPSSSSSSDRARQSLTQQIREHNRLANLVIESDLRRQVKNDILHHRTVGSYVGRRHAMGFPVRGQRTKTNAKTAKRLNRVERRVFSTMANGASSGGATTSTPSSPIQNGLLQSLKWRFRTHTAML